MLRLKDLQEFINLVSPPIEDGGREISAAELYGIHLGMKCGGDFGYKWTVTKEHFDSLKEEVGEEFTYGDCISFMFGDVFYEFELVDPKSDQSD